MALRGEDVQKHVNSKILLGMVVIFAFVLGSITTPAAAYSTHMTYKAYNESFTANANNHTYVYVPYDTNIWYSNALLHVTEDLDLTRYRYDNTGWTSPDTSYAAPRTELWSWMDYETFSNGPFGDPAYLPTFFDFTASDGSVPTVNTTLERWTFSLAFGQHTPVVVQEHQYYVGALAISGQEFVHLFVSSLQDDVEWEFVVFDPQGRMMNAWGGEDGDVVALPFRPSGPGTYMVLFAAELGSGDVALFDFYPTAVTPQEIALNEVVTDTLPTGELVLLDQTNSVVGTELMPTVHTYKFRSPNDVASMAFAFNYPDGFVPETQMTGILLTSNEFIHDGEGGSRYMIGDIFVDNGEYYYTGGPYYVTVFGGDNTEYTLYNRVRSQGNLPLNQEFLRDNYYGQTQTYAYRLNLGEDSVLRVNATIDAYDIYIMGALDDGYRWESTLSYGPTFPVSSQYYLPAGDYVVLISVDSYTYDEYLEFNLGPIQDVTSADVERLGGFFVDSSPYTLYNLTVSLGNHDNVTVATSIFVYDRFGSVVYNSVLNLANWWDGSSLMDHPTIPNEVTIQFLDPFCEEYAIVALAVHAVANNTEGASNFYVDYPVEYSIDWVNAMSSTYDHQITLDVSSSADSHNFTLSVPGIAVEYYGIKLVAAEGTWYEVSIKTDDVTGLEYELYTAYDMRTHHIPSGDLGDTEIGTVADMSFQFGAISNDLFLDLRVTRPLAHDGYFYIEITPMTTHDLPEMDPIRASGGDLLAALGGVAIPVAGGAIVVVVVVVLYFKKART
jgi:hypothetical protein